MKKTIFFVTFILITFIANSQTLEFQVLLDKYDKLKHEFDSIKTLILNEKSINDKKIKLLNDSISSISLKHSSMKSIVSKLELENLDLKNQLAKSDKKNINILELKLKSNEDSIKILNQKLNQINAFTILNEKNKFKEGRSSILKVLANEYESNKIDELIISKTKQIIAEDFLLLNEFPLAKKKILYLKHYFEARETLEKKYNIQEVNKVISNLDSIPGQIISESKILVKTKENLASYKICYDEFVSTIEKIIQIDLSKQSVSPNTDKLKRQEILAVISDYIYNYSINPADFPFISDLIFDIINKKQINPNADLSSMLSEIKS